MTMKARKINVELYQLQIPTDDGVKLLPYDVKQSMASVLLHSDLRLNGAGLLAAFELVKKINEASGEVLLSDEEYQRVKSAFDTVRGFGQNDVELVQRVIGAEEVEVTEKGK